MASPPPVRTLPTPLSLSDFDVGVTLGTGSFGRVRFSTHKVCIHFLVKLQFSNSTNFSDDWIVLGNKNVEKSRSDKITASTYDASIFMLCLMIYF